MVTIIIVLDRECTFNQKLLLGGLWFKFQVKFEVLLKIKAS